MSLVLLFTNDVIVIRVGMSTKDLGGYLEISDIVNHQLRYIPIPRFDFISSDLFYFNLYIICVLEHFCLWKETFA